MSRRASDVDDSDIVDLDVIEPKKSKQQNQSNCTLQWMTNQTQK